jgi:undecaprenyl-diphosphatase
MPMYQIVVLAIVQGLTEFLPISSTAHLYLTSWLFGWKTESLDFDIMLHLGTLLAVGIYFFGDWIRLIQQAFSSGKERSSLFWMLVIGSIPVGIAGLVFNKYAETTWRTPVVMGVMLIVIGVLMWVADNDTRGVRHMSSINLRDAITVGTSQALAIVPGCSRSGITITTGLFRDLTRESAARFSFLLSTPAIAAAAGKAIYDTHKHGGGLHALFSAQFVVGVTVSAATGFVVIAWFLQYLRHAGLRPFAYYRLIFGIIVLALAFIRRPA